MKIYLAMSGEYSDYRVRHAFARREDAEAYPRAIMSSNWRCTTAR